MSKTKIHIKINQPGKIIKRLGLDAAGDVQSFHTRNVLNRIKKYMPYRTGATQKLTDIQTDIHKPEIVTDTPYAKYLYRGKVMIDPRTRRGGLMTPEGWKTRKGCVKVETSRDLKYNKKTGHEGPYWDRALSANEGKAMAADLQKYIDRKAGKRD